MFAISESRFDFTKCNFVKNSASDSGAVLYSLYNTSENALQFNECTFSNNAAKQNLM